MDKCDKIVFAIGVLIGASLTMLATNIHGYRASVKARKGEDCDAKVTVSVEMIGSCETETFGHGEMGHE